MDTTAPLTGERHYVDTSAFFYLAMLGASTAGERVPAKRLAQAKRLQAFLTQIQKLGGIACSTVLAIEELAAKVRNDARRDAAKSAGFNYWGDFKMKKPSEAQVEDGRSKTRMVQMMDWAVAEFVKVGGRFEMPVSSAAESASFGEKLRTEHRDLLDTFQRLDAMDALHIVLGIHLGAKAFVSFDQGWDVVPQLTVYFASAA